MRLKQAFTVPLILGLVASACGGVPASVDAQEPIYSPVPTFEFKGWPRDITAITLAIQVCYGDGDGVCEGDEYPIEGVPIFAGVTCLAQETEADIGILAPMAYSPTDAEGKITAHLDLTGCDPETLERVSVQTPYDRFSFEGREEIEVCATPPTERGMQRVGGSVLDTWDVEYTDCRDLNARRPSGPERGF